MSVSTIITIAANPNSKGNGTFINVYYSQGRLRDQVTGYYNQYGLSLNHEAVEAASDHPEAIKLMLALLVHVQSLFHFLSGEAAGSTGELSDVPF